MASGTLVLHAGAKEIDRSDLASIEAPPGTPSWFPLKHSTVLEKVCDTLTLSGYQIKRERLAVGRDGHRFFGVLDLDSTLVQGVTLAVGVRNSTDKSFPLGFAAGARTFVCDNLAFRSELLVTRKHTRNGEVRFGNAIAGAVQQLRSFQDVEAQRIRRMQQTPVTEATASLCVLKALQQGIISAPAVPHIWHEILNPSFDYGTDELTLWSVLQSFTTCLGGKAQRNPNEYAGMTIRLNALLSPEVQTVTAV